MAKAKGPDPLIQNYPLGTMPVAAMMFSFTGTLFYGVIGFVVTAVIAITGLTLMVRKDMRMTNESVVRVSDYLSTRYGLIMDQNELKDYCKDLARKPSVHMQAKEQSTGKIVVHTLRFNDDFSGITVPTLRPEDKAKVAPKKRLSLFRR